MIDRVVEVQERIDALRGLQPRESVEVDETEDESMEPDFDKSAPVEVPGLGSDLEEEEIVDYTDGQLFSLRDKWRKDWTSAPSHGLGKIAERLNSLVEE